MPLIVENVRTRVDDVEIPLFPGAFSIQAEIFGRDTEKKKTNIFDPDTLICCEKPSGDRQSRQCKCLSGEMTLETNSRTSSILFDVCLNTFKEKRILSEIKRLRDLAMNTSMTIMAFGVRHVYVSQGSPFSSASLPRPALLSLLGISSDGEAATSAGETVLRLRVNQYGSAPRPIILRYSTIRDVYKGEMSETERPDGPETAGYRAHKPVGYLLFIDPFTGALVTLENKQGGQIGRKRKKRRRLDGVGLVTPFVLRRSSPGRRILLGQRSARGRV